MYSNKLYGALNWFRIDTVAITNYSMRFTKAGIFIHTTEN